MDHPTTKLVPNNPIPSVQNRIRKMPCGMYCDFGTSNQSFLDVAHALHKRGIKKWYFMLEVKFPKTGVHLLDPHQIDSKNPESVKDIARIHMECKANVWYFMRECVRVPARGAPTPFAFKLNRASCAMIWCYQKGLDFIVCQPRQTHKTTTCLALNEYSLIYRYKGVEIPFMHLKEDRVRDTAIELRNYIYTLPPYMNPFYGKGKPPGAESIKYDAHQTSIKLLTGAENEAKAMDKTRGMTLFTGLFDEWEYIPHIKHVFAGAAAAIVQARRLARDIGLKTCLMYASTPGNLSTEEGQQSLTIIKETPEWSEHYYDIPDNELEASLTFETPNGQIRKITCVYIEYSHIQILGLEEGRKWLTEQYEEAIRLDKMDEYLRGCLLQRRRSSDSALFRQEDIDYIIANKQEPDLEVWVIDKYPMHVYSHEIHNIDITSPWPYFDTEIPYMIGVDVASGSDGDSTVFEIVNPYTLQTVAELGSALMGSIDQMRVITFLASLLPKAFFCPESNNVGKTLIDFFQESPNLRHRVYYDPNLDLTKNVTEPKTENITAVLKQKAEDKKKIGVYVTGKNRDDMFNLLKKLLRNYRHLIRAKNLVDEISTLIKTKTGKIAAMNGAHDDYVMAYLHVIYIIHYGANLERFGIYKEHFTWEKAGEIIEEYEDKLEVEGVSIKPYDTSTQYENQLLDELLNNDRGFNNPGGLDDYGYKQSQYNQLPGANLQRVVTQNITSLDASDYAFLNEVNKWD